MRPSLIATLLLVLPSSALADRGALSADVGAGITAMAVPAPLSVSPSSTWGTSTQVTLGARYALRNWLELGGSAFFEPPVGYFHAGANVSAPAGVFPGTLSHRMARFGGSVGAYVVTGHVLRIRGGLEAGWSRRSNSHFAHYDVSDPEYPTDYSLPLADAAIDNLLLAPSLGVEWAFSDHASIIASPRIHLLIGPSPTASISGTVAFSYSWYL